MSKDKMIELHKLLIKGKIEDAIVMLEHEMGWDSK